MLGRPILSTRAKGITIFALGIAAFIFGFVFSIVFLILGNDGYMLASIGLGYGALAYGVYYRFVGFKRRFAEEMKRMGRSELSTLNRPDVIISPMFFLYGENLLRDDYGKFAAVSIMTLVTVTLAIFYWLMFSIIG
jgi:hypothetical protein